MIRQRLKAKRTVSKEGFRYRGVEPTRLEAITDAVFGFSITLIVISLQVPNSFIELQASMHGFLGFTACITLLLMLWNEHYKFHLWYGLEDQMTRFLNFMFLFMLLLYVYPLKYLFNLLGSFIWIKFRLLFGEPSEALLMKIDELNSTNFGGSQWTDLMVIYGVGIMVIYLLFMGMYYVAYRKRDELELNELERYLTKERLYSYFILAGIPLVSILIALFLPPQYTALSGMVYMLYGILTPIYFSISQSKLKKLGLIEKYKKDAEEEIRAAQNEE